MSELVEPRDASASTALEEAPPPIVAAPSSPHPAPRHRRATSASGLLLSLAATVVIALFVITFLVQAFQIPSPSMENTLKVGDYLLVDKVHYANGGGWGGILPYSPIRRGDIIVFRFPVHPAQHFVKRVIGLPGDHIRLVDKRVFVNGKPLDEPYAVHLRRDTDVYRDYFPNFSFSSVEIDPRWWAEMHTYVHAGELVVPADRYFVLGDNREDSEDSRYWGFVPRENIVGQPLLIYWSIGGPAERSELSAAPDGKLSGFISTVLHLFVYTRWERTWRLVK